MLKIISLSVALLAWPVITNLKELKTDHLTTDVNFQYKPTLTLAKKTPTEQPPMADTNALKQSGWFSEAIRILKQQEYEFRETPEKEEYTTSNRRNNLFFTYSENGFKVSPREKNPAWRIAFNLDKKQIGKGEWEIAGKQATYQTENIDVQYINNEAGMRQNFIVKKPTSPGEDEKIILQIKTGLTIKLQTDRLQFSSNGGLVMQYDQLKVWDANGQPLAASFEKSNKDFCIHVQSSDAVYPIIIDPVSSTPASILEENQAGAQFGVAVASAGDVNGDGYSDVIIGAKNYDRGQVNEGAVFAYYGSAAGLSTTASYTVDQHHPEGAFGSSVSTAGDVNGDGYSDVIVGAPKFKIRFDEQGVAFLYLGSPTGLNTNFSTYIEGSDYYSNLGTSVSCAGDVNGDGYSDVIVGVRAHYYPVMNRGAAIVRYGSPTGLAGITVLTDYIEGVSPMVNSEFGSSVAGAGDVNGDGYSDVIVGAFKGGSSISTSGDGRAYVFHGSPTGVNRNWSFVEIGSYSTAQRLGTSVACAGDVNGDGYSDVIIGIPFYNNGLVVGAVMVRYGSSAGISSGNLIMGVQASQLFGNSLAGAGDVNGDGFSDIIVGSPFYDNGELNEGRADIFYGSPAGINDTRHPVGEGNQASAAYGGAVASAGDVNGDGFSDVIVGAYNFDNPDVDEGIVYVYHGSASGISAGPSSLRESNSADARMGASIAYAGDVNGDGYSDVVVGAPNYSNGESFEGAIYVYHGSATGIPSTPSAFIEMNRGFTTLGFSVAGAGDVNGDGYADIIAGAPNYSNGENTEGACWVFLGSPTGINTTPAFTFESNQVDAQLGVSVAGAGDVNGDGYGDVIVGANKFSHGQATEGVVFVFHGSSTGINPAVAAILERDQTGSRFGGAVSGAGDVNGDGYSDVIVGANVFSNGQANEGAAFVYYGSASGLNTATSVLLEGNLAAARFGFSVCGAGDVNGDGFSDVFVGAIDFSNGHTQEGAVYVFHGSSSGINTTAAIRIERNMNLAQFGYSVGANDVNGDGYNDLLAGAIGYSNIEATEGAIYVYHGSPAGISNTMADRRESNVANAAMGFAISGAGDLNGDGYGDIVAGAPVYANGQSSEGAFYVFSGNNPGSGLNKMLSLFNSDLTTRIDKSNFGSGDFGVKIWGRSFLGRSKGKLVWETRSNGQAYSGAQITNSTQFTATQAAYSDLGVHGLEFSVLVNKLSAGPYTQVRARVKYDPVTALTGQMYGPWLYVPDLVAGKSMGALPVDLVSFKAEWIRKGQTAQVKFITDNESGICCYKIEKSIDGVQFAAIGKLPAKNSGTRIQYNFVDNNATAQKQFYRLKIISQDGTVEYSNLQWLQSNQVIEVTVFPNPTAGKLQLRLNSAYTSLRGQIMNASGQIVKQLNRLSAASQTIDIPVNDLSSGTYFLLLQSGEGQQVLQFVKQ
ncbi:FG-GAP-like repeat-containing protein [Pseudobacter ginsenosidimutans]|uniref:Putative secreted protein (Por secretion system target) n=1 Tax=Pseudobacter ginsenosidimutans TaxID=661488 RepID=A0A4Q7MUL6_9BACT|nr:FG-GAP-like repeat-containing protein [Pseudobacter ginsenosidimutans]QEC41552.1 T9SS type A sorting domain-containing protein [Pseudobacter ginsenosidimutans]RZS71664.1 putative secreted protein (Por secretion system target) [Pseudobacter ginsenosidimutans]